MDIVFIDELKIDTIIGIFDWERKVRQTVSLDLEMATEIKQAALSDHINDALDYNAVAARLIEFVQDSEFKLIETMAEQITDIIRNEFKVPWVKLSLRKLGAVPAACSVGVVIERGTKVAS